MIDVRDNWRIILLVILCILAALALFGPLGAESGEQGGLEDEQVISDPTNLQYGLDLSGGTRIQGTLVGMTATEVPDVGGNEGEIGSAIADELDLDGIDVMVRHQAEGQGTVEIFDENVTRGEFAVALEAIGHGVPEDNIEDGVTAETNDDAVETLQDRINERGLSGGTVTIAAQEFIVVEVPGIERAELRSLIEDPGRVQIVATWPETDGNETTYPEQEVLSRDDLTSIRSADPGDGATPPHVPVTISSEAAEEFSSVMIQNGFTSQGASQCRWNDQPDEPGWCLYTVVDGNITYAAGVSPGLGETIESGDFLANPSFQMQTGEMSEAQELELNLRAGELPTTLDIQSETFISPSLAQLFKPLALLTAFIAWLTVCVVVYYWYRDVRVAIPMLLTASSEVFLLLGFAAFIGMALDLSHIAGFIAVIGTGLDDLIIMADEILQRKQKVKTGRIFQNRFRKAFWIIGMAAATTIIAMSPLAILSLGELRGFAIVTIVGVLIGVGITRPAYGDVLRHLMLDDVKRK